MPNGEPTAEQRADLARCYVSCLNEAKRHSWQSIAFCCISTGIFSFPSEQAAEIAVDTVREWLDQYDGTALTVVFNVFTDSG